ncbi:hypothetical protein EW026_g8106 [Hermanssonia centrifuga]|uniref:Dienelactone hydrolase domain-containing protein n=1 Tax=Hermanssonia centrifuga TaxID=98765 RepID=A0A4S4K5G9_9APHY|nr:hypothetical protein EW026_g8106 [Hermanssonia centrifuga]
MACEHCTQGYIVPGQPQGKMVNGAYLHPAPQGSITKSRAIVIFTDIFGLPLKNCKLIADALSSRVGCDVWVPDLFEGKPPFTTDELVPILPDTGKPDDRMGLLRKLRLILLGLSRALRLYRARPAVVDARAIAFLKGIRKERMYETVGAVGYCFGGALAIRLGSGNVLDSIVVCHPTHRSLSTIQAINIPTSWVCAESDTSFTKDLRDESERIFAARKDKPEYVDYEFKDYRGTVHGFAARPNIAISGLLEAYQGALQQAGAWFDKTL